MREAFHSDLKVIDEDLLEMSRLVEVALRDASTALLDRDLALAERVIAADAHIDEIQVEVDELVVDLLARQSPVATDLRLLVAALRMSSTLERMGDLSEHVALVARRRYPESALPEHDRADFEKMAQLAVAAIHDTQAVMQNRDLALAAVVENRDSEIDDLMQQIYARVAKDEHEYTTAQIIDVTLLGRFYERLGDHAVSLVRRIGFLVTGSTVDPRSAATDDEVF